MVSSESVPLMRPEPIGAPPEIVATPDKMDAMPAIVDQLTGLDDEQREAVLAARGPLCVLAGAGTRQDPHQSPTASRTW